MIFIMLRSKKKNNFWVMNLGILQDERGIFFIGAPLIISQIRNLKVVLDAPSLWFAIISSELSKVQKGF